MSVLFGRVSVSSTVRSSRFSRAYSVARGRVYVVATPIGNYEDMGMRAGRRLIERASCILAINDRCSFSAHFVYCTVDSV